jgi:3-oxoacyl-[acyl-carrier protein] reductase
MKSIALVTGAARGIGAGIAAELERRGWRVVRNDLERPAGAPGAFVRGDISDLAQHARIVEEAFAAHGGLHCLVNNAGVQVKIRGDLLDVSAESFDRLIGVNLRGTFFLTQAVARRMLADKSAAHPRSIITISSVNAFIVGANRGEYCMSKSALTMMVKLFAVRLADAGIRCYEVRPGIIRTDMTRPAAERYDKLIAEGIAPIRRWGEPDDVGRAVALLASGELNYSTGEAIHVDGGMHVQTL